MKHFFARIGRFFWSRGFLKFVLWMVTLIVLFYVEEDWRGAHAWAATKGKWEARGETLDYAKFTPPPVPDAQNLGAIPFLRGDQVMPDGRLIYGVSDALDDAMNRPPRAADFALTNRWLAGEPDDAVRIRQIISRQYAGKFKRAPHSNDSLAQFDLLYPFVAEIREAAAARPYCRFDFNSAASRTMQLVTYQRRLVGLFSTHAVLALDRGQPELALRDLETIDKLRAGVEQDPSIVGALVASDIFSTTNGVIWDGLARHAWSDDQLARIDRLLGSFDLLANGRLALQGDAATTAAEVDYMGSAGHRRLLTGAIYYLQMQDTEGSLAALAVAQIFRLCVYHPGLWPDGWVALNKVGNVDAALRLAQAIDPRARLIHADMVDAEERANASELRSPFGLAPWNLLFGPHYRESDASSVRRLAHQQARVDESRIACALERYELAHRTYPATLDALVPAYISALPHDVMNGQPYHYRLQPDGTFVLYSVGWSRKDDGGAPARASDQSIDYEHGDEQGDWPWPVPRVGR